MQPLQPLLLLPQLLLQPRLLPIHDLPALPRDHRPLPLPTVPFLLPVRVSRRTRPRVLQCLQPPHERLVLPAEALDRGLARVRPRLRGVLAQAQHAHAWRHVPPRPDLPAQLEERLLELLDLRFVCG